MPETSPRERWILAVILAVGLLLRLTYLLEISSAPDFDAPQFEAQYHDYWARALLSGDWTPPPGVTDPEIRERPFFRPPGYPYFLAAIYGATGPGYLWPRIVQLLLGLASCVLLHHLARYAYGSSTGLFAAALAASYWLHIFFEGELMAVALLVFLLLSTLSVVVRWSSGFSLRPALVAGLLLGLTILVRPNAAVLAPVFALWACWLSCRRGGRSALARRDFLVPALGFVSAVVLSTLPATLRNLAVAGDPVWITSNAGVNLFVGTHPESDGIRPGVRELGELAGLESGWDSFDYPRIAAGVQRAVGRPLKDSQVSDYFIRRALGYAAAEPRSVVHLAARKLALFWGPAEVSNNKVIHFVRASSPTLSFGIGFATVLALALAGALWVLVTLRAGRSLSGIARQRQIESTVLLALVVVAYCASFLPFFVSARFRAPIIPLLMLFAGCALAELWQTVVARRHARLAIGVAICATLRLLTGIPWVPYEPDLALWHWRQGLLWQAKGETARAREAFDRAVAAAPDNSELRLSLAERLAADGRLAEAVAEYRAALALDSGSLAAHNNLARILAGQGDREAAIDHWIAALSLDPSRVSVLNNLAFALAGRADPSRDDIRRAVELAERAAELTSRSDPRILMTLAVTYRAAGRAEEAEETLRSARRIAAGGNPG